LARLFTRRRVIATVGVVVVVAAIVFIVEAVLAGLALNAAKKDGDQIVAALNAGDLESAQAAAHKLEKDAGRARSLTGGPLWWTAAHIPWLGKNLAAFQDTSQALDAIGSRSLPTLLHLADEVQNGTLRPRGGRIAPAAIAALAPEVKRAAVAIDGPAAKVAQVKASSLLPGISNLMKGVQERIGQARTAIDAAADAFQVLPRVLGGDGPRDYLLLVQNPAEIRASGGLPGTWALLHADRGRLTMTSTTFLGNLQQESAPTKITAEEAALFGSDFGRIPNEITATPDFPRAAKIAAAIEKRRGVNVSAVFSVDPIALAYVLQGTGPVPLRPGVTLTYGNVVPYLMNEIYRLEDPIAQNDAFALAAHKTFDALVKGQGNQVNAIRGLVQAVNRHRVFAWSADPELAQVINAQSLTGAFPADTGTTPQVGIYLNDAMAGKPEYYLKQSASVTATSCKSGVQTLKMDASFTSTMPSNAKKLPIWIVGTGEFAPKGDILMNAYLAAPWKGTIESLTVDGKPISITANTLNGRQLSIFSLHLKPGQLITVSATMQTGPGQTGAGKLTWTPGMGLDPDPATFDSAC